MGQYRKFMEAAYEEMKKTKDDVRPDKVSPLVGAILVRDGKIVGRAHRCQTRDGHHAEQTLLDDFNLTMEFNESDILFVTLEPCIPESRSLKEIACSQRIVEARIKHVYIGMLDPNPTIYGKGVAYLLEHGVTVGYFDEDITRKIKEENKAFINSFGDHDASLYLEIEKTLMRDLSKEAIDFYCRQSKISTESGYGPFWDRMLEYGLISSSGKKVEPTRDFLILFGLSPIKWCDGAEYHLEINYSRNNMRNTSGRDYEYIESYRGPMLLCFENVSKWIDQYVLKIQIRGSITYHGTIVDESVLKEAIINSIVHRDYDDNGDFNYFRIEDKSISVVNPAKISSDEFTLIKQFERESSPKNPRIARVFYDVGLMERHHYGMQTFKKTIPTPIYTYKGHFLSIFFPIGNGNELEVSRKAYGNDSLTVNDVALLNFIRSNGSVSAAQIAESFNVPLRTASYRIRKLTKLGLVRSINGEVKGARYCMAL